MSISVPEIPFAVVALIARYFFRILASNREKYLAIRTTITKGISRTANS
jgi:hypothetical protein